MDAVVLQWLTVPYDVLRRLTTSHNAAQLYGADWRHAAAAARKQTPPF